MKRILGYICAVFVLLMCFPFISYAQDTEYISLFKSNIELKQNTDIYIEEEIHYHFPEYKHGIYRSIPTDYRVSGILTRPTRLIVDELYYYKEDSPTTTFTTFSKDYSVGYTDLKIGDPDLTIIGDYVYIIKYRIRNYANYFDDHDEIYWNATGNEWTVPILETDIKIKVPGIIQDKICYTGYTGSTESKCQFSDTSENETTLTAEDIIFAGQGLTFAIAIPKGTLDNITVRVFFASLLANIGFFLPVPVLIFGLLAIKKLGKNKKLTIIPHYDVPKDIYPLLAGNLYSKNLSHKHITAQLIQLAIDKHIKIIQESSRSYILQKDDTKKEIKEDSVRALYAGIFSGKDSLNTRDISSTFYMTVNSIRKTLEKTLYDEKYYSEKRKKLWRLLFSLANISLVFIFVATPYLSSMMASSWIYGLVISTVILYILSSKVDLKDELGNKVYYELEGLKMYINTAEKHRIEFHNDPKKFKGVFEKLLPYAIIFGLEKKWVAEFEDIYQEPPSWFEGDVSSFNTMMLVNSFSTVQRNVQLHSAPPASHGASGGSGFSSGGGGGGSSGGGGGGGGGGSW
ncbi:MAG: DUF2207 domain-containing protein [Candidatus Dojkabacteria bacterium]|nr:DUF2207 domain-containing protein [Candidatus Dojkabacteria bacterium]